MVVRLHNLVLTLDEDESALPAKAAAALGIREAQVDAVRLVRRSLDARSRRQPKFVLTVDVTASGLDERVAAELAAPEEETDEPELGAEPFPGRPVIVGAGPAGLFAALEFARGGYRPLLIERGKSIAERARDVDAYLAGGALNLESNIAFGSGGAGAFSDGKLTTRRNHPRTRAVLRALIECGAPESIAYDAKPHIGTDRLRGVCAALERRIQDLGGEIRFQERVDELRLVDSAAAAVRTTNDIVDARVLVWAGGQHCRRSYEMLAAAGVALEAKPFQLGARIEHPQRFIDKMQYGEHAGHPRLPAADYRLVWRSRGRLPGVHSFCMCPGGQVLPACNEPRSMVTNGWSFYARDGEFANAALVATFRPEDFGDGPLDGLAFRRGIERRAAKAAGAGRGPVQLAADFLMGRKTDEGVRTSFPLGVASVPLERYLPEAYCRALRRALKHFDRLMPGFARRPALLIGPETRASSPVRILRDPRTRESVAVRGLYPAGEGAGYAGGIMTSILDGIETARRIMARYAPPR